MNKFRSMKMRYILLMAVLLCGNIATAQFILSGQVEYEKRMNIHALNADDEWFERMKAQVPKFSISYFNLMFDTSKSLYAPGREVVVNTKSWWANSPANENIVYTDISAHNIIASKSIFEKRVLITDSMRQLNWKEKEEIRVIAGYSCHKAVAVFCDSVYVVAFYCTELPASTGPEMFGGLPGLILELAIPRLHTTWIATKVEQKTLEASALKPPTKGKKIAQSELMDMMKSSFKDWGSSRDRNIWWSML
jgi:GLPGLI family protein